MALSPLECIKKISFKVGILVAYYTQMMQQLSYHNKLQFNNLTLQIGYGMVVLANSGIELT